MTVDTEDDGKRYRIRRFYMRSTSRLVPGLSGLTLGQAQAHCHDPNTSSTTATKAAAVRRTRQRGPWFDGYEEDR